MNTIRYFINGEEKTVEVSSLKEGIEHIKRRYSQINNWRLLPLLEEPGMRIHGDNDSPLLFIDIIPSLQLATHTCLRCGHAWHPRFPKPAKKCPGCNSPYWKTKRWKGGTKTKVCLPKSPGKSQVEGIENE